MGFTFENTGCHYIGDNLILVGTYGGPKTVQVVEWYFDERVAFNLILVESTCSLFGAPDAGYPTYRMTYDCTGRPTKYKATISNLDGTEEGEWGVRFSFTDSSVSLYNKSSFSLCTGKLDRQNSIYHNPALNKWGLTRLTF